MSNHTPAQNDYEKYAEIIKKFNRIADGGRNLFAIHENSELGQIEKHLMLTIAAYMDFSSLKTECSYCDSKTSLSINRLCKLMAMKSKPVVRSYVDKLVEKGYLKKIQTFTEDDKSYDTNVFQITDKIFVDYSKTIGIDLDDFLKRTTSSEGGSSHDLHPPNASSEGGSCDDPGVGRNTTNYIPNAFLVEEHNNKLLCSGGAQGAPTKQGKSKKSTPKERSRKLFRTIYRRVRQDHEPESKFVRMVTNEQMDTVFDRLYEKYPEEAFTKLYSDVEEARLLGARDWNPNAPEAHLNHICEKYDIKMKTPLNG